MISSDHIQFFEKNGYLVIPQSEHQIFEGSDIQQWCSEIESWKRQKGKWLPYDEINSDGQRQVMRVEKFVDYHPEFQRFFKRGPVLDILRSLSGSDMWLFKDKINFKYPKGNGFGAHTDAPAYIHIGNIKHLTCSVAIDQATAENGCLSVVPGSHLMEVQLNDDYSISEAWERANTWIDVPLNPGDFLLFGSNLAHRSGPNKSTRSRRALYATYHNDSEKKDHSRDEYYEHRYKAFPPDWEREKGVDYSQGIKRYAFAAPFVTSN